MDVRARELLEKLLTNGEKESAGLRQRVAALTRSHLADYRSEKAFEAKEAFEDTMRAAVAEGAVTLRWDDRHNRDSFIDRVEIADRRALAKFLGVIPLEDRLTAARDRFAPWLDRFPVLLEVIERWRQLRHVRGLGPESVQDWLDAVQTIDKAGGELANAEVSVPVREASSRIFKDSKRIEKLSSPIDVLLCDSVEAAPREVSAIWAELGLFREDLPVLMAGNVVVRRERVTACLDAPYGGLPAVTIQGLGSTPTQVMTIENKTTFHSEARRRCNEYVLLVYTAGMPSPAWREMYERILKDVPAGTPVLHWGDVDEGGFRIAAAIAESAAATGHVVQPWKMHPQDVPETVRKKATPYVLSRIRHFAAAAGWATLGEVVAEAGFTAEQEGLA